MKRGVERLIAPFDAATSEAGRRFLHSLPWWRNESCAPSSLTVTGAPVEVTYVNDEELRLTAEWGAPGSWISARWRAGRRTMKFYRRVTLKRDAECRGIVPSVIGWSANGTIETYGRVIAPRPRTLHALLAPIGVASRLPAFLDALSFFACRERAKLFDEIRLAAGIRAGCVTLYAPVRQLFDDHDFARARVLALARELRQSLTPYGRIRGSAHGLLGITLDDGPLRCSIGVAP